MAEIVNSLFGLSPTQIRQQQDVEAQAFGNQIASTFADPFERQQAAQGAMIGNALVKLGGKLFGLESPELKRATGLESILQQTTQEVGSQDPAVLYPVLAKRLSAAGFTREALQVGAVGEKAKRDVLKETSDMMYKDSMTKYNSVLTANQELALEARQLEQQGQVAYGALQAYKKIADPVGKTRVWETTLEALKKKGVDTSILKDIPWEQREATLDQIVESSDTAATRVKQEVAEMNNNFKLLQEQGKNERAAESNSLKAAIANQNEQIKLLAMGSNERIAAERRLSSLEDREKILRLQQANSNQAKASSGLDLKETSKQLTAYLTEDVGLTNPNEIKSALVELKTQYRKYLNEKDAEGFPKYDVDVAFNMAKQDIESKVQKVTKTFAGVPVGERTKFSGKATTPKVIKLD